MKLNELRIGNLVKYSRGFYFIAGIEKTCILLEEISTRKPVYVTIKDIRPVEVNPDWLLKFGFEMEWEGIYKYKNFKYYYHANGELCIIEPRLKKDTSVLIAERVNKIHRLQNIFHDLKCEDLKIIKPI
jgi:hypothetical protein